MTEIEAYQLLTAYSFKFAPMTLVELDQLRVKCNVALEEYRAAFDSLEGLSDVPDGYDPPDLDVMTEANQRLHWAGHNLAIHRAVVEVALVQWDRQGFKNVEPNTNGRK